MSLFGGDTTTESEHDAQDDDSDFAITPIKRSTTVPNHGYDLRSSTSLANQPSTDDEVTSADDSSSHGSLQDQDQDTSSRARYPGQDQKWLQYTTDERLISKSLDESRNQNLALHLYIAQRLKSRARDATRRDDQGDSTKASASWAPQTSWTAWPLEPDIVPRPRNTHYDGDNLDFLPHAPLQGALEAIVLRQASKQWTFRPSAELNHAKSAHLSSPPVTESTIQRENFHDGTTTDAETDHQSEAMPTDNPSSSRPVFSADDDRSRQIMRPTIKHIISRLDALLTACHQNRAGHYALHHSRDDPASRGSSRSRSRSRSIRRFHAARQVHRARSGSDSDVPRGRKRVRRSPTTSPTAQENTASPDSDTSRTSQTRKNPRKESLFKPRDWSSVLGIAAMTGWDADVIKRTAARCTALFDEQMDFRNMDEAPSLRNVPVGWKRSLAMQEMATSTSDSSLPTAIRSSPSIPPTSVSASRDRSTSLTDRDTSTRRPQSPSTGTTQEFFLCQFCPSKCTRRRDLARHVHSIHGLSTEQAFETVSSQTALLFPSRVRNPRNWKAPDILLCPHPSCHRSSGTKFTMPRRLVDHIRRIHRYDPRKEDVPAALKARDAGDEPGNGSTGNDSIGGKMDGIDRTVEEMAETEAESTGAEMTEADLTEAESTMIEASDRYREFELDDVLAEDDFLVGGVRNDGFLQPIPGKSGKRGRDRIKPGARSSRSRSRAQSQKRNVSQSRSRSRKARTAYDNNETELSA